MEIKQASLVITDISGYTRYVKEHTTSALHAEQHISDLLESVATSAEFPLSISKFEGDAVFLYAAATPENESAVARDVIRQVLIFADAFKARQKELVPIARENCSCEACTTLEKLRLKTVLHHGEVVFKKIRQFEEIGGEPAIVVHRLLKNSVPTNEYIMMTNVFYRLSGGIPERPAEQRTEKAEGIGPVPVHVYYPAGYDPKMNAGASNFINRVLRLLKRG